MDTIVINNNIINIVPDAELFQTVAEDFMQLATAAVKQHSFFRVALSGGDTPRSFFEVLVEKAQQKPQFPWHRIIFFFGDERYVAASDPLSNYHSAYEYLFSKLPIAADNIKRIPTEIGSPLEVALQYQHTLRATFHVEENELPQFDLVYLGLGKDAHTASLMPGTDAVKDYINLITKNKTPLVTAVWVNDLNMYRITLTPPILNNSIAIRFLVKGIDKAAAVKQVLQGPRDPLQYPAQLIHGNHAKTVWYLDKAAAQKLKGQ